MPPAPSPALTMLGPGLNFCNCLACRGPNLHRLSSPFAPSTATSSSNFTRTIFPLRDSLSPFEAADPVRAETANHVETANRVETASPASTAINTPSPNPTSPAWPATAANDISVSGTSSSAPLPTPRVLTARCGGVSKRSRQSSR